MSLLQSIDISATGLSANRTKMNIIAENLANTETTRTFEGGPYKRKMVVFEEKPIESFSNVLRDQQERYSGVKVTRILRSQEDSRLIYNPSHPDADPDTGYVSMPNVDLLTEISDMVVARRAYDACIAAMSNTKSMILKTLEIGK
ncbi:MAG TPA: flagellar basal body rod protein FlgC [Desulfobacteraceae bacterium]|nr:flagellar basal body rod protein FlgC [Desulfobacteraceae bacterium]